MNTLEFFNSIDGLEYSCALLHADGREGFNYAATFTRGKTVQSFSWHCGVAVPSGESLGKPRAKYKARKVPPYPGFGGRCSVVDLGDYMSAAKQWQPRVEQVLDSLLLDMQTTENLCDAGELADECGCDSVREALDLWNALERERAQLSDLLGRDLYKFLNCELSEE